MCFDILHQKRKQFKKFQLWLQERITVVQTISIAWLSDVRDGWPGLRACMCRESRSVYCRTDKHSHWWHKPLHCHAALDVVSVSLGPWSATIHHPKHVRFVFTTRRIFNAYYARAQQLGGCGGPDPQNLDGPPQLFWWRVWLPLRNRLQCTKLGIPSRILFCTIT